MSANNDYPVIVSRGAVNSDDLEHGNMRRARKDFVGRTHDAALGPGVRELLDGDALLQGLGSVFLCELCEQR